MGSITLTLLERLAWFTTSAPAVPADPIRLRDAAIQKSIVSLYYSNHVEVLVVTAEASLQRYHSMVTIQNLISVWTALLAFVESRPPMQQASSSSSQYSNEALHARKQVLHSMFRALDYHVEDMSMPSSELIFTSKMQVLKLKSTYLPY